MKKQVIILGLTIVFAVFSSGNLIFTHMKLEEIKKIESKRDTVLVFFNDELPRPKPTKSNTVYKSIYKNFTKDIEVTFDIDRNYDGKTYTVWWFLWLNGVIAESGHSDNLKPKDVIKYKAKVRRIEDSRVPELLEVWKD